MIIKVKDARELRKMLKEKFGKETVKKAKLKIKSSSYSDNIFVNSDLILMTNGTRYVTREQVDEKIKKLLDYVMKNIFKKI
jgi:hypothetical protein